MFLRAIIFFMKKVNVTEGPIWTNMLSYFLALVLGAFFQQFYNTIDAVIVGRAVSSDALGAVGGSAAMVVLLFVGFFMGLSSGATVVISQFYGAGRKEDVEKAVHTAIALAVIGGAVITVVGLIISPGIIRAMNTPPEQVEASIVYLRIYFLGMTANLVYNMGSGILRAVGDSKRPLIVLIISCFANIFLDVLFVIALGFGKKGDTYGVIGVGVATVLCQIMSAAIVIIMLKRAEDSYKLYLRKIKMDMQMLIKIIRIGLPAGFQTTMYTLSNTLIQTSINQFGKDTTAAWAAYGKIDVLFWMTMNSMGTAVTTFAGQNFGAGKYKRVRESARQGFIITLIISIPLSIIMYFNGELLLMIFVTNENVIAIGDQMIRFLAPFYTCYIAVEILSGTLRGMGDALIPMLITLSGICILRVGWILFAFPHNPTVEMILTSYPLTWITTSVLFIIYYFYYINKKKIR